MTTRAPAARASERDRLRRGRLAEPGPRVVPGPEVVAALGLHARGLEVDHVRVLGVDRRRPAERRGAAQRVEQLAVVDAGVHAGRRHAAGEELEGRRAGLGHPRHLVGILGEVAAEAGVVDVAGARDRVELLAQPLRRERRRLVERHVDHGGHAALDRRPCRVLVRLPRVAAEDVEVLVDESGEDDQAGRVQRPLGLDPSRGDRCDAAVAHPDVHPRRRSARQDDVSVHDRKVVRRHPLLRSVV